MTEVIDFKKNSLILFRFLAALNVLWGHTLTHMKLPNVPLKIKLRCSY